jgi:hypothetical protein
MITILIIFFLVIIACSVTFDSQDAFEGGVAFSLMILFTGILIISFVHLHRKLDNSYYTYQYKDQPIKSLVSEQGNSIKGGFLLGTGVVNGGTVNYYVAYANFPQGNMQIRANAFDSYIVECDTIKPVIRNYWVKKSWKGYKSNWFLDSKPIEGEWKENIDTDVKKIVIVPTKTIYMQYKVE